MTTIFERGAQLWSRLFVIVVAGLGASALLGLSLTALAEARPASLVRDIHVGGSSTPRDFTLIGDSLFFVAEDADHGAELWMSDGTEAGTNLVRDIAPAPGEMLVPGELSAFQGLLYFRGNNGSGDGEELWVSDGTVSGTVMLKDIDPTGSSFPSRFREADDTLYFVAADFRGEELWKTDGSITGTVIVSDINPSGSSMPRILTPITDTLFFVANDGVSGEELWKSDGTITGTMLVKDINPGAVGSLPRDMVNLNGTLLFTTIISPEGRELWRSDGTAAGTYMVQEIAPGDVAEPPNKLTVMGSHVFFTADDGTSGTELWKSDGTGPGTMRVRDIVEGPGSSLPNTLTAAGSVLYFSAVDGVHGRELWRSDGSSSGTTLVKDINPGTSSSSINDLAAIGQTLYFSAIDGVSGRELWRSDGGEATTFLLSDVNAGGDSDPKSIVAMGSTILFSAYADGVGRELWAVDPQNVGPTADAGSGYSGLEGQSVVLNGVANDGDGDALDVGWTVNSALCTFSDAAQLVTSLLCADEGTFEATLTVTDPFGLTASDNATIAVENMAPEIDGVDDSGSAGSNVLLVVSFQDAGTLDAHSYEIDWGDGEVETGVVASEARQFLGDHHYRSGGDYVVDITLSDDDGGSDSFEYEVTISYSLYLPALFKP